MITHINAITFFLCILNGSKQHLLIFHRSLSLSIVLTQLNRWCARLFDMTVCSGHISSFIINPNGLYPHVPSRATEFELALALIFKTGSTLLVHHWQPGGLRPAYILATVPVYDPTELSRANRFATVQRSLSRLLHIHSRDTIQT